MAGQMHQMESTNLLEENTIDQKEVNFKALLIYSQATIQLLSRH